MQRFHFNSFHVACTVLNGSSFTSSSEYHKTSRDLPNNVEEQRTVLEKVSYVGFPMQVFIAGFPTQHLNPRAIALLLEILTAMDTEFAGEYRSLADPGHLADVESDPKKVGRGGEEFPF